MSPVRKTLRSLQKKAVWQLELHVHRDKMQLSGSETVNLGGNAEEIFRPMVWDGGFFYFKNTAEQKKYCLEE